MDLNLVLLLLGFINVIKASSSTLTEKLPMIIEGRVIIPSKDSLKDFNNLEKNTASNPYISITLVQPSSSSSPPTIPPRSSSVFIPKSSSVKSNPPPPPLRGPARPSSSNQKVSKGQVQTITEVVMITEFIDEETSKVRPSTVITTSKTSQAPKTTTSKTTNPPKTITTTSTKPKLSQTTTSPRTSNTIESTTRRSTAKTTSSITTTTSSIEETTKVSSKTKTLKSSSTSRTARRRRRQRPFDINEYITGASKVSSFKLGNVDMYRANDAQSSTPCSLLTVMIITLALSILFVF